MGLLIPCAAERRDLDIFAEKVPKVKDNANDNCIGGSDGESQVVFRIYGDDDAEPPQADAERGLSDGGVGI